MFADSDYESEEEDTSRMSMVSGPKVRKFTDTPWDAIDEDGVSVSGGISRMLHAAKSRTQSTSHQRSSPTGSTMTGTSTSDNTRRAMALFGKGKQLFPSSSGISLASSHSVSTTSDHLVTPKLKAPFGSTSPARTLGDHGHMSRDVSEETLLPSKPTLNMFDTGATQFPTPGMPTNATSPGFGLISLEQAQERERTKSHKRTGTAHKIANVLKPESKSDNPPPPNRVKAKKSGIMKMFNKDKATGAEPGATLPKLPTPPLSSSLRAAPHPNLPRPSVETSDAISVRSGATSLHSPMVDKPLPPPHISPPKKSKEKRSKEPPRMLGEELQNPRLELRPVSMNFSNGFASDYLATFGEEVSSGASSPAKSAGPLTPSEASFGFAEDDSKDQLANARKAWRLQQYEFEAQIRDLQQQLEDSRKPKPGGCDSCGCACGGRMRDPATGGVMDRARAKTGGARFGTGNLYE